MRIGHKRDPFRSNMRVEVVYENESLIFVSEVPTTISTILNELDIPSSTVLAVYNDTIVPHSSTISEDIKIELIVVSSGG
jgi:sulfur carrier protein ThiS